MVIRGLTRGVLALSISLLMMLCCSFAVADDTAGAADSTSGKALVKGAKALQFQVVNNFQLSSFDGATISLKKHCSATSARRLGLTITGSLSNEDSYDDAPNFGVDNRNVNALELDANILFMKYRPLRKSAYFYCGIGPSIGYGTSETRITTTDPSINITRTSETRNRQYKLIGGGVTVVGVDWFVAKGISLSAEYGLSMLFTYVDDLRRTKTAYRNNETGEIEEETYLKRTSFERDLRVQSLPVKLGASVYF